MRLAARFAGKQRERREVSSELRTKSERSQQSRFCWQSTRAEPNQQTNALASEMHWLARLGKPAKRNLTRRVAKRSALSRANERATHRLKKFSESLQLWVSAECRTMFICAIFSLACLVVLRWQRVVRELSVHVSRSFLRLLLARFHDEPISCQTRACLSPQLAAHSTRHLYGAGLAGAALDATQRQREGSFENR